MRDALFALAARHLAPNGILFASYNTFPGCHAPPRVATTVVQRPLASPLARWQATHRDHVTNLRHETVRIGDAAAREVLTLLDGSRDRGQLVAALGPAAAGQDRRELESRIEAYLQAFARLALLLGP